MLVAGEKSSLLISIVFRKRVEEETISFPGFENRFFFFSCFSDFFCLLQAQGYYSCFSTTLMV